MNDYKLINSLLEDGSDSSILKLKMIVDFNNLSFDYIKSKLVIKLIDIFRDSFEKDDIKAENILRTIDYTVRFELVMKFKNCFERIFAESPSLICCFNDDEKMLEIAETFRNSFCKGFTNNPHSIRFIYYDDERFKIVKMFKDCFYNEIIENYNIFSLHIAKEHKEEFEKLFSIRINYLGQARPI